MQEEKKTEETPAAEEAAETTETGSPAEVSTEAGSEDKTETVTESEESKETESQSPAQTPTQTKPSKEVSPELEKIIKSIETMTVLELADLVKALEVRFGVTAAAPLSLASAPAVGGAASEAAEEQSTFTVVLASAGANKIGAIKAVREIVPTLGLKEAKDLVDSAPKPIVEGVSKEAANEAKGKLEAAGAQVELK